MRAAVEQAMPVLICPLIELTNNIFLNYKPTINGGPPNKNRLGECRAGFLTAYKKAELLKSSAQHTIIFVIPSLIGNPVFVEN